MEIYDKEENISTDYDYDSDIDYDDIISTIQPFYNNPTIILIELIHMTILEMIILYCCNWFKRLFWCI